MFSKTETSIINPAKEYVAVGDDLKGPRNDDAVKAGFNFYAKDRNYKYVQRSCGNCKSRGSCVAIIGKDWREKWLDLGRYGCRYYSGKYQNEKPRIENPAEASNLASNGETGAETANLSTE